MEARRDRPKPRVGHARADERAGAHRVSRRPPRGGISGADGRTAPRATAQARGRRETGAAACPHFPACVGCPQVASPYAEQLGRKQAALRAALGGHAELGGVALEAPFGSPSPFGYRNHAKLVFRARRGPAGERQVMLGVYRPGTHSVVPAHGCIVHHRLLQPVLAELRRLVEQMAIPIFDERSRAGALRYALARASTAAGEVHLTLVSAVADPPHLDDLVRGLRRGCPQLRAVFLCVNPTSGNVLLSPEIRPLMSGRPLVERFGDLMLESRPDAFLQANTAVAARLYESAARWLEPSPRDTAVDLYCGVGAIALRLAPHLARVLGIEAAEPAVACAQDNARRNGVRNAAFVAGEAEAALRIVAEHGLAGPSIVVVNPPRRGLGAAALAAVIELAPQKLLYVSCDPTTLARDLAALARAGWATLRLRAFDMLPQTPHLEALALLQRGRQAVGACSDAPPAGGAAAREVGA